mmetsp:Transcript_22989/g.58079  ORF Transcript_22989/g.58079 Transcript_22989/m.58079 type:complete len:204 (-) Transcript_22989:397-1008(-)
MARGGSPSPRPSSPTTRLRPSPLSRPPPRQPRPPPSARTHPLWSRTSGVRAVPGRRRRSRSPLCRRSPPSASPRPGRFGRAASRASPCPRSRRAVPPPSPPSPPCPRPRSRPPPPPSSPRASRRPRPRVPSTSPPRSRRPPPRRRPPRPILRASDRCRRTSASLGSRTAPTAWAASSRRCTRAPRRAACRTLLLPPASRSRTP